ncbi:MAG: hypothetical protein K0S09_2150 [Sphingobacteriaceae bacterium]|jgi:hypothetical protein|nr:hypothetical protein [Sphingobacteriaceae bacterium]
MLDEKGRASYQQTPPESCPFVDQQRAVDEIALINNNTGEVTYGIYSLFVVLANSFPTLRPFFSFKPFAWLMSKIYAFISFNRRVIVPPPNNSGFRLQPTFKLHYRLTYIFLLGTGAALIFSGYIKSSGLVEIYVAAMFLFQGIICRLIADAKTWDYLGNLATITFMEALLFLPVVVLNLIIPIPFLVFHIYAILVAGLMLFEHIRRTRLIHVGSSLNFTWAAFQLLIFSRLLIR